MTLGLSPNEQSRLRAAALSWRGTPFHKQQARKGVGADCLRMIVAVYLEVGLIPRVVLRYPWGFWQHQPDSKYLEAVLSLVAPISPPWEVGDVLTFRGRPWPGTGHTALYLGGGDVIHAIADRAVDVWPLDGTILAHTIAGGWRLRRA